MGISQMLMKLAEGMATSCWIFGITLLFSLPLGMVIAFGRMSKKRIVQGITKIYISIMRGTPLMLQLMVVYFGPYYLFGIKISPFYRNIAVVIGFVLNYAAYFAEIYRSGIESMPVGQYEAAEILGYSKSQTFHSSAGDQTHPSVGDKRSHHTGQGYFSCLCDCRIGDVYDRKGTGIFTDQYGSVCGSRYFLLCI